MGSFGLIGSCCTQFWLISGRSLLEFPSYRHQSNPNDGATPFIVKGDY